MKMKKWIALLLACVMALSLMACTGGQEPDPTKEPDQPSAPAESPPATPRRSRRTTPAS